MKEAKKGGTIKSDSFELVPKTEVLEQPHL
jgi:hypothetical protein